MLEQAAMIKGPMRIRAFAGTKRCRRFLQNRGSPIGADPKRCNLGMIG
jgi:hypothetical protein